MHAKLQKAKLINANTSLAESSELILPPLYRKCSLNYETLLKKLREQKTVRIQRQSLSVSHRQIHDLKIEPTSRPQPRKAFGSNISLKRISSSSPN